jgi:hypothetical protein
MELGAKIVDGVDYLHPPLQSGSDPEDMYLVMRPLKEIDYLSKESVVKYIDAIYTTIYQYQGHDLLAEIACKNDASQNGDIDWLYTTYLGEMSYKYCLSIPTKIKLELTI